MVSDSSFLWHADTSHVEHAMSHADTSHTSYAQCRGVRRIHLRAGMPVCVPAPNSHTYAHLCIAHRNAQKKATHFRRLPFVQLGYKDSNLEMLESESSALPFGDSPSQQKLL